MPSDKSRSARPTSGEVAVVVPTYRRGATLLETLRHLFALDPPPEEILVVDQTEPHPPEVEQELRRLEAEGRFRLWQFSPPSIPRAMNAGLREAKGAVVLHLDDDVEPASNLVAAHAARYAGGFAAVCGQVLHPGKVPDRVFGETINRYHLKHPGKIPAKMFAELRMFCLAVRLHRKEPWLLPTVRGGGR